METLEFIRKERKLNYIFYSALFMACLMTFSCSEKKTPGGIKYKMIRKGDGAEPVFGQFLVMNMDLKDSKDSIWFTSKEYGDPVVIPVPDASMINDDGEYGVFKAMTKGDSVYFQLPARIVFAKTRRSPVPKNVDPNSLFSFNVGLKDVWTQEQVNDFQQHMLEQNEKHRAKNDSSAIAKYLQAKGINALSTPSGLRYVVKKEGRGERAASGKTAYVNYAGYLLEGSLFDTNIELVAKENKYDNGGRYRPYPVVVNTGGVIRGWDQMLLLMNKGMGVTVYVPSALAYGGQSPGRGIPANAILVFDLEVVDIK